MTDGRLSRIGGREGPAPCPPFQFSAGHGRVAGRIAAEALLTVEPAGFFGCWPKMKTIDKLVVCLAKRC